MTTRCRSFSSRPERASSPIPSTFPGRWATTPTTRPKPTSTPRTSSKTKPDGKIALLYQNDGFGKDYLKGLQDVLGADHAGMLVKDGVLRDLRAHGQLADRDLAGFRGGHPHHRGDAEIRRPGDPQILRSRLERDPLSQQRLALDRHGPETGWPRQVEGSHHQRLRQGSDRRDARRTIPASRNGRTSATST